MSDQPVSDDASTTAEILGPQPETTYYGYYRRDWIDLCPDLKAIDGRAYGVLRSLVYEVRGLRNDKVYRLTLAEMCELIPGVNNKPISLTSLRDSLRRLSIVGLVSDPEGEPLRTSSRARAAGRPLRMRVHDTPCNDYVPPWSNTEQKVAAIRAAKAGRNSDPDPEAGRNSDPVGRNSDPRGRNSDPDYEPDQDQRDPDYGPVSTYLASGRGNSQHTPQGRTTRARDGQIVVDALAADEGTAVTGVCDDDPKPETPMVSATQIAQTMAVVREVTASRAKPRLDREPQHGQARAAVVDALQRGCTLTQIRSAAASATNDQTMAPGKLIAEALASVRPHVAPPARDRVADEAAVVALARRMPTQVDPVDQGTEVAPQLTATVVERRPGRDWRDLVAQYSPSEG